MGLEKVFVKAAGTAFRIFADAIHYCTYTVVDDTGFSNTETPTPDVPIIMAEFDQNDLHYLSFSKEIQHTDTKGLVRSESIPGITPRIGDKVLDPDELDAGGNPVEYTVKALDKDPYKVLYTLLLRVV